MYPVFTSGCVGARCWLAWMHSLWLAQYVHVKFPSIPAGPCGCFGSHSWLLVHNIQPHGRWSDGSLVGFRCCRGYPSVWNRDIFVEVLLNSNPESSKVFSINTEALYPAVCDVSCRYNHTSTHRYDNSQLYITDVMKRRGLMAFHIKYLLSCVYICAVFFFSKQFPYLLGRSI